MREQSRTAARAGKGKVFDHSYKGIRSCKSTTGGCQMFRQGCYRAVLCIFDCRFTLLYGLQAQNYTSSAAKNTSIVTIKDWIKKQGSDFIFIAQLYFAFCTSVSHSIRPTSSELCHNHGEEHYQRHYQRLDQEARLRFYFIAQLVLSPVSDKRLWHVHVPINYYYYYYYYYYCGVEVGRTVET